ncbi:MAG: hypothetical protein QOE54_4278, partial [Streptosporangiaceae bacterium]|nr:hypothetical protein [Streptosporangiaceae bacterium]
RGTGVGRLGAAPDVPAVQPAVDGLEGDFAGSVIACGAGVLGGLQQGVFATAHAQVLVAPCTANGAVSARCALDWFAGNGHADLISGRSSRWSRTPRTPRVNSNESGRR